VSVGPALPVLKYISTFRSGDARGEAAGWVAGWSVASRPSLPAARRRRGEAAGAGGRVGRSECPEGLVGRMLRDIAIREAGDTGEAAG